MDVLEFKKTLRSNQPVHVHFMLASSEITPFLGDAIESMPNRLHPAFAHSIHPSIHPPTHPPIHPPIYSSIHPSLNKSLHPSIQPSFRPSSFPSSVFVHPSVTLFVSFLRASIFARPSARFFVCSYVHLSHLHLQPSFIHLFIYLCFPGFIQHPFIHSFK